MQLLKSILFCHQINSRNETSAKLQETVLLNGVKNLIKLEFCNVKILHFVQDDKYWCFARVSITKKGMVFSINLKHSRLQRLQQSQGFRW